MNAQASGIVRAESYLSTNELDAISRVARDGSAPAGLQLADLAADLLNAPLGERERSLICDILFRFVCKAQEDLRSAVSSRLAPNPNAPRNLILFLANDEIGVARPVLIESEVLNDLDLVQIVRRRSVLHGRSVAIRGTVSETVGESLIARGDTRSIAFLLQNAGANISFAAALSLARAARTDFDLRGLLLNRLSPEMARDLYWHVSGELRGDIRGRFDGDPGKAAGGSMGAEPSEPRKPSLVYVDGNWAIA